MKKLSILIATAFVVTMSLTLYAHSGRTDASGGHYNRKTGEYHYHNSGSKSSYSPPSTPSYEDTPSKTLTEQTKPVSTTENQIKPVSITENHWQVALNRKLFAGQLEAPVASGRVDILTETEAVEVDKVSKYEEGIAQALKYASATGKKPVLAVYIDGQQDGHQLLKKAEDACNKAEVRLVLVNCYVSVNDLVALASLAGRSSAPYDSNSGSSTGVVSGNSSTSTNYSKPDTSSASKNSGEMYWLNTASGVRHNSGCRYYMNTKNGRKCTREEGRACGICGG